MFVKYFIPEDGDEQAHPNVFRLDSTQPTFPEIKRAFPVAGNYHFRFLKNIGSHIVWLDVVDDGSALPMFQGSLFIKASRIANSSSGAASTRSEFAPSLPPFQHPEAASPRASEAPSVSPPVKAPKPLDKQKSEKLLQFDGDGGSSPRSSDFAASTPVPAPSSGASLLPESDLLGIGSAPVTSSTKSVASADFFGLEALQPMSAPVSNGVMGGSSQRSHSPMNPMNPMNPMAGGSMGGGIAGKSPMGGPMGGQQNIMGGGRGMPGQGQGMQGGMGAPPPRQMGGPGTPGYDPFNNIAGLNGIGQNQGGRGNGMNGRR